MLLVIDVGNTNTVLGVFEAKSAQPGAGRLLAHWRVSTIKTQMVDEYGVLFRNLFAMHGLEVTAVQGIVISSVVPPLDSTLRETTSNVVAVPKSTTMHGPPYFSNAATLLTMRSAPTSAGLS